MNFKKLSVLFCSLLALTSVMAVSAAEAETVSETEAASEEAVSYTHLSDSGNKDHCSSHSSKEGQASVRWSLGSVWKEEAQS